MASVDLRIKRAARRSRERWAHYNKMAARLDVDELDEGEWILAQEGLDELKSLYTRHDLEELRELLTDEVFNMRRRLEVALGIRGRITTEHKRMFVKHLHMMTFDDTYRDYATESKNDRSRKRIESLIELCHNDEVFFLREYIRALENFFPVSTWSSHYVWKPRLFEKKLKSGKIRTSLKYHMGYRSRAEAEPVQAD